MHDLASTTARSQLTQGQQPRARASAIVTDQHDHILLHRRSDNQLWSIPDGPMEIGETIRDTVIRGLKDNTGPESESERLDGIYARP